jgi:hypothetical protein
MLIFRSIDGSDNNLAHPEFNSTGAALARSTPAEFADDISEPRGGVNPRTVSNVVVGEGDAAVPNSLGLSGMMYAWGQFIDHDLDLMTPDRVTDISIHVPSGDPFLPDGSVIPITRVITDPDSGTGVDNPAIAINTITGWLDASMVYGSSDEVAASLRGAGGHLATSARGNLPIVSGQFLAGDTRVSENPSLTALQTLFVREHNYQVDQLKATNPGLSAEELYQQARAIVTAEIAHITYEEFLPHLLGAALPAYGGYDSTVDARITVEFAGAAYRFGHSLVSDETDKVNEYGHVVGSVSTLQETFFQPPQYFIADSGADGMLRHLGTDPSQAMDIRIVDSLRNFLVEAGGAIDLASLNIARGRDLGLGTLNETRVALGLDPYTDFDQITTDTATAAALAQAYASVDDIDLWTGGLSEGLTDGAFIGPTFGKIIADQFIALRDGDRFWYENQGFDAETLAAIGTTSLSDIILRNTDTRYIQDDMFVFHERRGGAMTAENPDAPQLVIGSTRSLVGGSQNDMLVAGGRHQSMTGLEGDDWFVVEVQSSGRGHRGHGQHSVTIVDFEVGSDTIHLNRVGNADFDDLVLRDHGSRAIVQIGKLQINLLGVQSADLTEADFIFA